MDQSNLLLRGLLTWRDNVDALGRIVANGIKSDIDKKVAEMACSFVMAQVKNMRETYIDHSNN